MSIDTEKKLQHRVIQWLMQDLGYQFLGDLTGSNNEPVKDDLLRNNLIRRGYSRAITDKAITHLRKTASNQTDSLCKVNEEVYSLLRYGYQGVKDKHGNYITVHYIDWKNAANNDFYAAEEVSILRYDHKSRKRPDIVLYVNGIAVVMFELKRSSVSIGEGIRQMITNQKKENIQGFFSTVQLLMAGNESQGLRYGVIGTPEKYYLSWREDPHASDSLSLEIRRLQEGDNNRLRRGVISLCHKERILQIIHGFMIFDSGVKKTARHNQYFAVIAAQARIRERSGGIIWNTQGSGKSLIMVWLTKWIRENITDSRVVIITDREELENQIAEQFHDVKENTVRLAKSCADLRAILNRNEDAIICSLIHKYGHNAGKQADIDMYSRELAADLPNDYRAKGNIIGFIDECHRTNSGKLHKAVRLLMPDAVLIGFTGTPLLKTDKKTSLETFGAYIHTYKFDEGVNDGVILDLRYEARDVDQRISSQEEIDSWFESKTTGLTEGAKLQLKKRWATLSKLYSSKERLERIALDILYDMDTKPRLVNDRGTAMLAAGSIYEACRYWEIFQANGLKACAVVTSYEPSVQSLRTAASDLSQESEEEYKKRIYDRMLCGKTPEEFEKDVRDKFIHTPENMKLLIVVDKLLTGFDAPSATYLYIDKKMRDHDLFQTICRTNRPDGNDKDYGYIIDYMDLFRNIQSAVHDYTSEAFDGFDKKDIEGFIKGRYDEAKAEMCASLSAVNNLLANVGGKRTDADYIEYFCGSPDEPDTKAERRNILYTLTSSLTRSFANCCDRLVSHYGYTDNQVNELRKKIYGCNRIKAMVKLASCDYIDLKPYEADMRYILDSYIRADNSTVMNKMADMSLVELLIDAKTHTPEECVKGLPGDDRAKAEIIENNLAFEIVRKKYLNEIYYGRLSAMLEGLIIRRRLEAISYDEYLRSVVDLARAVIHPENDTVYPEGIRESAARRAIYDYLGGNEELAKSVDETIRINISIGWKEHHQKQQKIKGAIYTKFAAVMDDVTAEEHTEAVYDLAVRQDEYDK